MNKKITSVIFLLATMAVISSGDKSSLPDTFSWPQNTKNLCFAARFNLKLNVDYITHRNSTASVVIPLNDTTFETYSVSCSAPDNVHQLVISMLNPFTEIIFNFVADDKNFITLKRVYGYITVDDKQSFITDYSNFTAGLHNFSSDQTLFEVSRGTAYQCDAKTSIEGFPANTSLTIKSIDIENLQMNPFADDSKEFNGYSGATVCKSDSDKNSNLVPIIVGACLAAMVVIVLVAYLIGRRRSRSGYQSV